MWSGRLCLGLAWSGLILAALAAAARGGQAGAEAEVVSTTSLDLGTDIERRNWLLRGDGYQVAFDATGGRAGSVGIRLSSRPGAPSDARASGVALTHLAVERARGRHLRLTGWMRSAGISRGWAGLWVRVDGPRAVLAFDNMADRGLRGTTPWTRVSVEADVPGEAAVVAMGALLAGDGSAWVSDLQLTLEPSHHVVEGVVEDPAGRPLAGALVAIVAVRAIDAIAPVVQEPSGPAAPWLIRTGADGSFRATVPAGGCVLTVTAEGFLAVYADVPADQPADRPADRPAQGILLRLTAGGADAAQVAAAFRPAGSRPAPGTHLVLTRAAEDGGGSFYFEVGATGGLSLRVPPGRYTVALDAADYDVQPDVLRLHPGSQAVSLVASLPPPVPPEVVAWLRTHAVALPLAPAAGPPGALGPHVGDPPALAAMVGHARVVAMGEANHGSRELVELRRQLLAQLVAASAFGALGIEADGSATRALDAYVRDGAGDPVQALAALADPWDTAEMLDVVAWMRAQNAAAPHRQKLRLFGFDAPADGSAAAEPGARDRRMASSVVHFAEHEAPGARIVLWGHNGHLGYRSAGAGPPSMGDELRRELGGAYLAIGNVIDHGAFATLSATPAGSFVRRPVILAPSPAGSLANAFHRAGFAAALLDLTDLRPRSATEGIPGTVGVVGAWLAAPHLLREDGIFTWTAMAPPAASAVTQRFDALLYVDRVSPSHRVTPGAF